MPKETHRDDREEMDPTSEVATTTDAEDQPTNSEDEEDGDLTESERRLKEEAAEAKRDAYKARKKREALEAELEEYKRKEEKEREAKLKKNGEYEELLKQKEEELAGLREKATRFDVLEGKVREQLLDKLPKKLRDKYEAYDVEILSDIVADFIGSQPVVKGSQGADIPNPKGSEVTSLDELTPQQEHDLFTNNRELWTRLSSQRNRISASRSAR